MPDLMNFEEIVKEVTVDSTNLVISDKLINLVGLAAQGLPSPALYVIDCRLATLPIFP